MNTSKCNMFVRTMASENDHNFPRNEKNNLNCYCYI